MSGSGPTPVVRLRLSERVAVGGDGLSRLDDGKVVFVEGGLPGEELDVRVGPGRRDFARGRAVVVHECSPYRVRPSCPSQHAGCGGCPWQHVAPDGQLALKQRVVVDALRRSGGVEDPPTMRPPLGIAPWGYRSTVRLGVDGDGRPAYRRRHAHDLVVPDACPVAHPLLEELVLAGRFPGATSVTLRVGVAGGERLAVLDRDRRGGAGGAGRRHERATASVEPATTVVARDGAHRAFVTEAVAGRMWRVSGASFFQSGPAAAELLCEAVGAAAGDAVGAGRSVVDLYAGVGLLGGSLVAAGGGRLMAVESSAAAVADARANLADLDARVERGEVARWRPVCGEPVDVVVADPSRPGLGRPGVGTVAALGAPRVVLVSCDPASLARDSALLRAVGYRLVSLQVLDLFPHTVHVEAVAGFER